MNIAIVNSSSFPTHSIEIQFILLSCKIFLGTDVKKSSVDIFDFQHTPQTKNLDNYQIVIYLWGEKPNDMATEIARQYFNEGRSWKLISCRIENCAPPLGLGTLHALDLTKLTDEISIKNFEEPYTRIVTHLKNIMEHPTDYIDFSTDREFDIFVSYARNDREIAARIVEKLEEEGHSVWWDPRLNPNEDWMYGLKHHLNSVKCVIVIWSSSSVRPDSYVRVEATEGSAKGDRLLSILAEPTVIPPLFARKKPVDLVDWVNDSNSEQLHYLLERVEGILANRSQPDQPDAIISEFHSFVGETNYRGRRLPDPKTGETWKLVRQIAAPSSKKFFSSPKMDELRSIVWMGDKIAGISRDEIGYRHLVEAGPQAAGFSKALGKTAPDLVYAICSFATDIGNEKFNTSLSILDSERMVIWKKDQDNVNSSIFLKDTAYSFTEEGLEASWRWSGRSYSYPQKRHGALHSSGHFHHQDTNLMASSRLGGAIATIVGELNPAITDPTAHRNCAWNMWVWRDYNMIHGRHEGFVRIPLGDTGPEIHHLCISESERYVLFSGPGTTHLVNIDTGSVSSVGTGSKTGWKTFATSVFHPERDVLANLSYKDADSRRSAFHWKLDIISTSSLVTLQSKNLGVSGSINYLSWSPCGRYIVYSVGNGDIGMFDLKSDEIFPHQRTSASICRKIEFSPDGTRFAYVSSRESEMTEIWDVTQFTCVAKVQGIETGSTGSLWHPVTQDILLMDGNKASTFVYHLESPR